MRRRQGGLILICVMIYLTSICLLIVGLSQITWLNWKTTQQWQERKSLELESENVLSIAQMQLVKQIPSCYFDSPQSANAFINEDLEWWKTKGCDVPVADGLAFYVVEKLDYSACANVASEKKAVYYYRITNYVANENQVPMKIMKQMVVIIPTGAEVNCQPSVNLYDGRQSLRAITTFNNT